MKKPLGIYQGQIRLLKKQRVDLDEDFAQVIAEALFDGYNIHDVLDTSPNTANLEFDL